MQNDIINAIETIVDNAISKAGFDRTRSAIVVGANANNTYKIKMDGIEYNNVVTYGNGALAVGAVVKVIIPNGQASQMFILIPPDLT